MQILKRGRDNPHRMSERKLIVSGQVFSMRSSSKNWGEEMAGIVETIANFIISLIESTGYIGIFFTMVLESACIPLPSEIIMPFSGYVAWKGNLNLYLVVMAGALGNLVGSWIAYFVGIKGGRPFLEKYGKYIFITKKKLEMADKWFKRYGHEAVFISRVMPIVRTFISLPAGTAKMDLKKFSIYTFIGSIPWCYMLAYVGYSLGPHWKSVVEIFHKLDYIVAIGIVIVIIYIIAKNRG